ncbi:MAG TPA: PAS domain S-box protein [Rhodocyclaceae bacterium]|nr:PAS domain S-box protein [Rhodocyclaceae bacterium]
MSRHPLPSSLVALYGVAAACFAQSAVAYGIAEPWSPLWWLANGTFVLLLLVSGRVIQGLLSARSLPAQGGDDIAAVEPPQADALPYAALVEAEQANAALSRQVILADQAKRQFESVFALAPDATLIVSADGSILKVNERARSLFGYGEEDFSGLKVEDLIPGQYRHVHERHREGYQHAPEARMMSHRFILPGLRRDGSTFPAEISLGPLEFDDQPCVVASVRDVTESRRIADHIKQNEQRFRGIFDHAPIGMALTDLEGRLAEANESLCKLLGYSHDELVGKRFQDITHPDDVAFNVSQFERMVAGELDNYRMEKRYLHRDGTPVWTLLSISLQRDAEGRPLQILSHIIDIGGMKDAQQALAESEVRLQRVLEGSNDGFWDRHIPTGTTTFSPRWATMLGYDSSEIAPNVSSWEKLVHPDDLAMCRRILAEHLSGERDRYEAVYRMRHRAGHWVWILARGKAYEWDEAGTPLRMAGTHTDVTVRQLTTEALRLRERTLKAVLEALPIGVWIADANGRITSANAAALAMGPGVRYRALADDRPTDSGWGDGPRTVTPHDWALAHAIERREKIRDQLVEMEFADGSKKTVLNSGLPILDEEGNPLGAIAVNQDMTQWLKLEQDLLRRTHQLEESNRELEQFAYVASHDLQEPLRKVSSFAQLFAKKYSDRLDETGHAYINFMVDGASRMQILVDDLLHYSRLTRGDRSHRKVDMDGVLAGVLADLQLMIREADASIQTGPMPVIVGDAGQLRALVQNLINNAVKYRAPERTPEVHIGASVQGGEATFWVRDNGIGIDPRYFDKIFVIFQRLHARSEYPGTGIGLAICKKIVDNHGGRIWVESSPGQGATFFFTMPTGEARK